MRQEQSARIPWTMLGSACLLGFAMFAPMFCVPPMEHILKEELVLTHAQTSLLFTAPVLMMIAVAIPAGFIADRIGVRKAAGIGAIIMAVGTILRGTATNPTSLLAFTYIYGIGIGWCYPSLPKLVSRWVPREQSSMAIGIFMSGMFVGEAVALAITMPVIFAATNTFQSVFFIWSIPPIVAAILWWILVREPPDINLNGEPKNKDNTLLRQILRNRSLWLISVFYLLYNIFYYTWAGWAPALVMLKGASPDIAGLITSITLWVSIPALLLMPKLSYRLGLRKPFLWAPAIALAVAAWAAMYVSLPMSWPLMALVGVALGAMTPIMIALPVEILTEKEVGTASGLLISVGHIGAIIGPLIGGRILDLTGSLDLSLLVLTGVSLAAVGIALRLPETGPKARSME